MHGLDPQTRRPLKQKIVGLILHCSLGATSRIPTWCSLDYHLHLTELLSQLLFGLVHSLVDCSPQLDVSKRTLGAFWESWILSNSSLVVRTISAGCRDRPRLKKKAMVRWEEYAANLERNWRWMRHGISYDCNGRIKIESKGKQMWCIRLQVAQVRINKPAGQRGTYRLGTRR